MLCIGTGSTVNQTNRMKFENDQFYMKTEEEMREAMKDFPEACDNTVEVAAKCDVTLEREPILPKFPLPAGETEESWFRKRVQEGLVKHYGNPVPQEAQERADYEMGIIIQQGFPAYFLIVQEYINWAKSQASASAQAAAPPQLARGVRHGHHRHRAAHERPAVRAIPFSRARGDARYRRRLRAGPPRRGHQPHQGRLWRGSRLPGDHLRHAAGQNAVRDSAACWTTPTAWATASAR